MQAVPDVFSIRNTSAEPYLEPIVHEIKVSRNDLLGDLKQAEKRAAYLGMASQVYYVLGMTVKGQQIAEPEEIPSECGVILTTATGIHIARVAPRHRFLGVRFDTWMSLAKSAPLQRDEDGQQQQL